MDEKLKSWKRCFLYIPFLAELVFWLIVYSYTFLQGDDYWFIIGGGSFSKIWEQYLEYYTYGGARMGNLLAGVFLMTDMRVWKIMTAFVATAVSLAFFYYIRGSLRSDGIPGRRIMASVCVCAVFPGLLPMTLQLFSDSFLWLDGSTNYIYPFLLMMVGFLPFYNELRGRALPKIFSWLSPVCFVAAVLLHEQITTMMLCMCVLVLLYLRKNQAERIPLCLKVLTAINAAALILMLTAPGAYSRMKAENGVKQSAIAIAVRNFRNYFAPLVNDYWPWLVGMGLAAAFLLRCKPNTGKVGKLIQLYLCFGALLAPLSRSLRFPMLQLPETPGAQSPQSRFQLAADALLILYWLLYISLIFVALLISAHEKEPGVGKSRYYLPVLYAGMWGSQTIPAVAVSSGSDRARMPLYAFALLLIFCILWDSGSSIRWAGLLQSSLVLIGIVSFACIARSSAINGAAAENVEGQILEAQRGERSTVLIDYNQFDWTLCNVTYNFKPGGYEVDMRKYYSLPDTVKFEYTRAKTGRGAKIYSPR